MNDRNNRELVHTGMRRPTDRPFEFVESNIHNGQWNDRASCFWAYSNDRLSGSDSLRPTSSVAERLLFARKQQNPAQARIRRCYRR